MPAIQEYTEVDGHQVVKAPMGAKTDGGSLTFHNLCSLLKVTVNASEAMTLNQIQVTATSTNLSGSTSITLGGTDSDKLLAPETGSKKVTLVFPNGMSMTASESKTFYIYVPEFSSQNVTVEIFRHDNNNWKSYKKSITGASASANRINTLTCNTTTPSTIGALPGDFSLANGTKVRFSQGNLQTVFSDANTISSWRFADNQYDAIGGISFTPGTSDYCITTTANNKISTTTSNQLTTTANGTVIDLYIWVGANSAYAPYGVINNQTPANYGNTVGEKLKADWGANTISNGGNTANQWRTMTSGEWDHLLNKRSGTRYALCVIAGASNGYPGMIIFPDGFDQTAVGVTINSANTRAAYTTNAFTTDQWTTLQNAGCVFLPAAGYLDDGTILSDVGSYGNYWSSTSVSRADVATPLFFCPTYVRTTVGYSRRRGHSVRLVQDY